MSALYSHAEHDSSSYQPPRGPVLLLSCMDPRLLDNIVHFMNHDNLINRYDHVVLAGAALGALGAPGSKDENGKPTDFKHWKQVFFDHLGAAVDLHQIRDVYILEHRNCGAYYKVFHVCHDFDENCEDDRVEEEDCHRKYALELESEIAKWAKPRGIEIRTHKFLMDLRGTVAPLRGKEEGRESRPSKKGKRSKK